MTTRRMLFLFLFSILTAAAAPKKILFIGNSYTGGIKGAVTKLIKESPHADTELTFINPGGKTLEFHLKNKATTDRIKSGKFDFIVLQDQSQFPAIFPKRFDKAAVELDKIIDQSGAQTVFYQTWGRRDGDKMNKERFPTYEKMQKGLSNSYSGAAQKCRAKLARVGDTWALVRKADDKLGRELYRGDGSHPSGKGAYLAACVFYRTFFNEGPAKSKFTGGLTEKEVQTIRTATNSTK